jgi:hypothetical protein
MDAQVYFFNYCNQMDLNQSSMAACAAAKIRDFSMSYIILLNNIRLFNFFVSVYYD